MAAIIALPDEKVEEICEQVNAEGEVCVPANYNCPGQLVISGTIEGINKACELMKAAGAKRALPLKVGGAFHSPLMQPAKEELEEAIQKTNFNTPKCPIYQNVDAKPHTNPEEIRENLVAQLTSPVRFSQSAKNMAQSTRSKPLSVHCISFGHSCFKKLHSLLHKREIIFGYYNL